MGKCIQCGTNFVGTPENPPADALCKYCEIENLKKENRQLKSEVEHYRSSNDKQGRIRGELALSLERAGKREKRLTAALRQLIRASSYVLQHKFGENDPVGTRLLAIEDLRLFSGEAQRVMMDPKATILCPKCNRPLRPQGACLVFECRCFTYTLPIKDGMATLPSGAIVNVADL